MNGQQHRRAIVAVQALLSAALLAWLMVSADWRAMVVVLRTVSPAIVGIGVGVYLLGVLASCLKWHLLLRLEGMSVPISRLARWYLIGAFASNFLPTDIGGDFGRGYLAARATRRPLGVARSILLERLSGLLFLLGLAGTGALALWPAQHAAIAGALAVLLTLGVLGWSQARHSASGALAAWQARIPARLRALTTDSTALLARGARQPTLVAMVLILSLGIQLLAGLGLWLNMRAVGLTLPLWPSVLAWSLASAISLLPVSINGWGVREGLLVALLTPLGAESGAVLAGALLARGLVLGCSLPGALLLPLEARGAPLHSHELAQAPEGYDGH